MAKRAKFRDDEKRRDEPQAAHRLKPETKRSIAALVFSCVALLLVLAALGYAGPAGKWAFYGLSYLFGWGYYAIPFLLLLGAGVLFVVKGLHTLRNVGIGLGILGLSLLGIFDIALEEGGIVGKGVGFLEIPFGRIASFLILVTAFAIGALVALNTHIRLPQRKARSDEREEEEPVTVTAATPAAAAAETSRETGEEEKSAEKESKAAAVVAGAARLMSRKERPQKQLSAEYGYVAPPLSLLKSELEQPTTGDLRANANIIRRTLESFGIPVEMGEINIGPKVTRYTLKPAEGVKISRITALHQDLALALAAHPIRIEAPIPGKSLVGIEVPNKAAALVRLGSLLNYPEFRESGPLTFIVGRDVTGEPFTADIDAMPHLLVAGATGSGKSIMFHSILISLLYKNSPQTLRMVLIDPKRVELSVYEGIPHLVTPVITESKKAVNVFRWAIKEMERRYDVLLKSGCRDVRSYQKKQFENGPMPYLLVVVDELADLMTSYGREVEGSIVRLAQMARATGIHLVLSTQRPSVEVITGLIKANITTRMALQVASQVDSRTILDMAGAEKLLGGGDLLFISAKLSKPKRIQGSYVTEEEIERVASFVRDRNPVKPEESAFDFSERAELPAAGFFGGGAAFEGDGDELYDEAVRVVTEAKKASASLLQRRLKVGYARAARLLDLMEEHGVIGPGEGAKPREVFVGSDYGVGPVEEDEDV